MAVGVELSAGTANLTTDGSKQQFQRLGCSLAMEQQWSTFAPGHDCGWGWGNDRT